MNSPSELPFPSAKQATEQSSRRIEHFIDGKIMVSTSGRAQDVFNPATGEVRARVALASSGGGRAGYLHLGRQ